MKKKRQAVTTLFTLLVLGVFVFGLGLPDTPASSIQTATTQAAGQPASVRLALLLPSKSAWDGASFSLLTEVKKRQCKKAGQCTRDSQCCSGKCCKDDFEECEGSRPSWAVGTDKKPGKNFCL